MTSSDWMQERCAVPNCTGHYCTGHHCTGHRSAGHLSGRLEIDVSVVYGNQYTIVTMMRNVHG